MVIFPSKPRSKPSPHHPDWRRRFAWLPIRLGLKDTPVVWLECYEQRWPDGSASRRERRLPGAERAYGVRYS